MKEIPYDTGGIVMLAPTGRGMYIWKLGKLFGGNYEKMLEWAIFMKLDWVCVKVLNGKWKYNYWNGHWHAKDFVKFFQAAGIEVHGWQWVLMDDPVNEGKAAVNAVKELGLNGFAMNIEDPCKNVPVRSAVDYSQEITAIELPVGFCSYRFPTLHREILYSAYIDVCTYLAPEIYWAPAPNPVEQLLRSYKEYEDMDYGHLPFSPLGAAYGEHGHRPLPQELIDFNAAVIEEQYPSLSWWRFGQAVDLGYANLIAKMPNNYAGDPVQPPPPTPATQFKTLANLNVRETAGTQAADVGTLKEGSDITLVERDGVWGKIEGWVHTDYLEPL